MKRRLKLLLLLLLFKPIYLCFETSEERTKRLLLITSKDNRLRELKVNPKINKIGDW